MDTTDLERLDKVISDVDDIRLAYNGLTYATPAISVRNTGIAGFEASRKARIIEQGLEQLKDEVSEITSKLENGLDGAGVDGLLYQDNILFLTRKGEPVCEGVEIVGGSGGGSGPADNGTTLTIENESETFSVSSTQEVILKIKFSSAYDKTSAKKATCFIKKGDSILMTKSIRQDITVPINVTSVLTNGVNEITVECSDIYQRKAIVGYVITVVNLEIGTTINDAKLITTSKFTLPISQVGNADKTVHITLGEGQEAYNKTVSYNRNASKNQSIELDSMSHGAHMLHVYMTADIYDDDGVLTSIPSNHIRKELVFVEEDNPTPIVASYVENKTIEHGDRITIPYIVYDPQPTDGQVVCRTSYMDGGRTITFDKPVQLMNGQQVKWEVSDLPEGQVTLSVIYTVNGNTYSKSHVIEVTESTLSVDIESSGLALSLSAAGKGQTDADRDKWICKATNVNKAELTGFNWKTNGWMKDSDDRTCLRLNGDARAVIDIEPFYSDEDIKDLGKTIELEFAIRDVNDRSAVAISCFDGNVGFVGTADKLFLQTGSNAIECNYIDDRRIIVSLVINPNVAGINRFVSVYLDGILSNMMYYSETTIFGQSDSKSITIGSDDCGIDLYSVRVYNKNLSDEQVLNNFIASEQVFSEKRALYNVNNIFNDGKISYKLVKDKVPTIVLIGKLPTFKGDKKKDLVRMIYTNPDNHDLDFDEILSQIDVQGTSSQFYVRKNWKTKHANSHVHKEGELASKVFCIKVDYAEATGTHNTQNANFVEELYSSPVPPKVVPSNIDLTGRKLNTKDKISKVRTTITGFPVVIFHFDTDDTDIIDNATIADLEERYDEDLIFSSKGNFNFDKGSEDVFAFNDNYVVECWEFAKNEDQQSFLTPWPDVPIDYWEPRYHKFIDTYEDLIDAKDKVGANKFAKENMLRRFKKMYEWVHSTATGSMIVKGEDGQLTDVPFATNATLSPVYVDKTGRAYNKDTDEYRLAKFKDEFESYFNMHYSAIYYVYTFFALMVDQRAKNMFLTYWPDNAYDEQRKDESDEEFDARNPGHWYPYFYDNDTCFGISNKGHLDFDYYHQDTDSVDGSPVYNGSASVLWTNFRKCFPDVIQNTYKELRSSGKITFEKLYNRFVKEGSDAWAEAIYNQDADYKYVSVESDKVDDKVIAFPYLYQIRGNGEQHLEYFLKNRIKFCDSKWQCGEYSDSNNIAIVNIYNPTMGTDYIACANWEKGDKSSPAPEFFPTYEKIKNSAGIKPPSADISIVPYSRMYYAVQYGAKTGDATIDFDYIQLATKTGEEGKLDFMPTGENTNYSDFETTIYGAGDISSFGDLSNLYAKQVIVSSATKLTELIIGNKHEKYFNPNLETVSVGNNTLLRELNVANCPNLSGELEVSGCLNIEKIYAEGTSLTSINLPIGGILEELHLPATTKNLILRGQDKLTIDNIELDNDNLEILVVDSCANIDAVKLLDRYSVKNGSDTTGYNITYARLTDVNLGTVTYDYMTNVLAKVGRVNLSSTSFSVDIHKPLFISGTCKISYLTGNEMSTLRTLFPELVISFDSLEIENIVFKSSDGNVQYGNPVSHTLTNGNSNSGYSMTSAPEQVMSNVPMTIETEDATYMFEGWSRVPNGPTNDNALNNITSDITLYAAYSRTPKHHTVTFMDGDRVLKVVTVEHGQAAIYGESDPISSEGEMFDFICWEPSSGSTSLDNITEDTICYAQWEVIEKDIPTTGDSDGKIRDMSALEFTFEEVTTSTAKITSYDHERVLDEHGRPYTTGEILSSYTIGGKTYTIISVDRIGAGNSGDRQISYILLPDTLETIESNAFSYSRILAIHIPKSVKTVSGQSYRACSYVSKIVVDPENQHFREDSGCLIRVKNNTVVTGTNECTTVPQGATEIESGAFWGRTISTIKLPDGLRKIGQSAFANCNKMRSIEIPGSVTHLDGMVFYGAGLDTLEIPESIVSIGGSLIMGCENLYSVTAHITQDANINNEAFRRSRSTPTSTVEMSFPNLTKSVAESMGAPWGAAKAYVLYKDSSEPVYYD